MPLDEEPPEFSAGGIKRSLLIFPAVVQKGSAVFDLLGKDLVHRPPSQRRVVVEIADELAAEHPHVVNVLLDGLGRQVRSCQVLQEGTEQGQQLLAGRQIFLQAHPRTWPTVQIPAIVFESMERCGGGGAVYLGSSRRHYLPLHAAAHHNSKL